MRTQREIVVAILIDGGFYRRRAKKLFGEKSPQDRTNELVSYCKRHVKASQGSLYRIFYYDCPPSPKVIYHPLKQQGINLQKTDQYRWSNEFFTELMKKRKVAFRRGEELQTQQGFLLRSKPLKDLCSGKIKISDLKEEDFTLDIVQKGVDMRLGLDIATLAQGRFVNQIIMISGDSDFVPAAKHARREGIDFILDPMWSRISDSLSEHVDGIFQCVSRPPENEKDPLYRSSVNESEDERNV